jgi:capsular exopolysaccharide synthesis family protein
MEEHNNGQPPAIVIADGEAPNPEVGEDAWSPARLVGMVRRKALIIGICAIAVSTFMAFRASKQVATYQGSFRILVEPVREERELAQLTNKQGSETTKTLDYSTQIEVLLSPKLLNPILKEVSHQYPGTDFSTVSGTLSAIRLGETKIIEVSYADVNPHKVKLILEKVAQGYLEYSIEDQRAKLRQGLEFIRKQLPAIQKRVNSLQQQIQDLRQKYDFINPDTYSEQLSGQLSTLAQERQTNQADLAALQIRYRNLETTASALALAQSADYQKLLQQFQAIDQKLAIESARFGPRSPEIQLLQRQQQRLLPLLQNQAKLALNNQIVSVVNEMQILTARDRALATAEQMLNQMYRQMPAVTRLYNELQQELSIANSSLTRFLETQETLQIQASQNEVPWQLINPPGVPQRKSANSIYKVLSTGAIAGLGLGLVVAFLWEKLENTYYTTGEFKKKVKLPILGIIPFHPDIEDANPESNIVDLRSLTKEGSRTITEDLANLKGQMRSLLYQAAGSNTAQEAPDGSEENDIRFEQNGASHPPQHQKYQTRADYWLNEYDAYGFLEAFRAFHANITRQHTPRPLRSLVISSALPTEGRTTIAVHLVQAAAAMGRRVLLVDAHLRRGGTQLDILLGIDNQLGLSDFLTEKASLNQTIQRLSWESSLFVISAGSMPPDPTRLLSSKKMHELMTRIHQVFDLVVYDMPPLMGLADVNLIAAKTDGVVLVSCLGKWGSAEALNQTVERLKAAHLPILGVVINKARDHSVDLYLNS